MTECKNIKTVPKEWFGKIPSNWTSQRIKTLFDMRDERSYLPLSEVNLISLYTSTGVHQHSDIEHTTGNKARNADGYKIVAKDDIVVNILLCWMGAIGRSDYNGVTSPAYDIYIPKCGVNSKYYHYLFRTSLFSQQCYKAGKGIMSMRWRTYSPQFRNIVVPVPPLSEQDHIVRFLDWKISSINKLINIKKKEVEGLRHISQKKVDLTFSHNSNNATDSEWIVRPLKYFVTSNDESLTNSTPDDYEFDYIDISSVGFGFLKQSPVHYIFANAPSRARRKVQVGDTIISTVRTYLRSLTYIDEVLQDCIVSTGFSVLRPKSFVYPQILNYALSSNCFIDEVMKNSIGVSYPSINDSTLLRIKIALPFSLDKQKQIVQQLNQDLSMINNLISTFQNDIQSLHELRDKLISDVVTGKIDVCNVEIPDYEYIEEENDIADDIEDNEELTEEE